MFAISVLLASSGCNRGAPPTDVDTDADTDTDADADTDVGLQCASDTGDGNPSTPTPTQVCSALTEAECVADPACIREFGTACDTPDCTVYTGCRASNVACGDIFTYCQPLGGGECVRQLQACGDVGWNGSCPPSWEACEGDTGTCNE